MAALLFRFIVFFYYLDFPIEGSHVSHSLPPKIGPSIMKIKKNSSYEIHLLKEILCWKKYLEKSKLFKQNLKASGIHFCLIVAAFTTFFLLEGSFSSKHVSTQFWGFPNFFYFLWSKVLSCSAHCESTLT